MPSLFDEKNGWKGRPKRMEAPEPPTMQELNDDMWKAMRDAGLPIEHSDPSKAKGRPPERISRLLVKIEREWRKYPDIRLGQLIVNLTAINQPTLQAPEVFYVEDETLEELLDDMVDLPTSTQEKTQPDHPNVAYDVASMRAELAELTRMVKGGETPTVDSRLQSIHFLTNNVSERLGRLEQIADKLKYDLMSMEDDLNGKLDRVLEKLGEPMGPQFQSIHEVKGRQPGTKLGGNPPTDEPFDADSGGREPNNWS